MRLCVGMVLFMALLVPSAAGAQADCDLGCQIERLLRGILEGIFGGGESEGPGPDRPTEPGAESTGCSPGADFWAREVFHLTFGYGERENRNEFESSGWRFSNLVVEAFE